MNPFSLMTGGSIVAVIMYFTKVPKYQNILTNEVETLPREDLELIDKYFTWKMVRSMGGKAGNTLEEWCGIPQSKLAHKYVVNYYREFFVPRRYYNEYAGYTTASTIFQQLARIPRAPQFIQWFIDNVDNNTTKYWEISKDQLQDLFLACKKVKFGFISNRKSEEKFLVNKAVAKEYLPLPEWMSEDAYDHFYASKVIETMEIIRQILFNTDFEKETIYVNYINM